MGVLQPFVWRKYNRVVTWSESKHLNKDSQIARLIFYIFVLHVLPLWLHGLNTKGFMFSIVPIYVFSVLFMLCSQINHLTPQTHEQFSKNFFIH